MLVALYTQSLSATLSFTGGFSRGWTHLLSFTATLFHGTGGGGTPDLINENFEGTGAPSLWGGGADFDYTTVVLSGTQSCDIPAGVYAIPLLGTACPSEVWGRNLFQVATLATGTYFNVRDSAFTGGPGFVIFADGSATLDFSTFTAAGSFVQGTTYYFWLHYKASVVWEVWWDTENNRATAANHLSQSSSVTPIDIGYSYWGNIERQQTSLLTTFNGRPPTSSAEAVAAAAGRIW